MLTITTINEQAPHPKLTVNARLYVTADGERLVGEGNADAAFLFCAPGQEVAKADFERYTLDDSLDASAEEITRGEDDDAPPTEGEVPDPEAEAEPEADEQPESDADEKAVEGPPKDKQQKRRRTKAV